MDRNLEDTDLAELKRQVAYYRSLSDEVAGQNIRSDSQISLLKRKLAQKENGFTLLSSLHDAFGQQIFEKEFFSNTLELINLTLKMDFTMVVWKADADLDVFTPKWHMGYQKSQTENFSNIKISFKDADQSISKPFLANKLTKPTSLIKSIREELFAQFFIAVPIRMRGQIVAWMISGRDKEAWPFYAPLDEGDVDTLVSISGFIESALSNSSLYSSLEKANAELEANNRELEQRVAARTKDLSLRNKELSKEKKRSDDLLLNILPQDIADELKKNGFAKAKLMENATVMFTDFVNFTKFASFISSEELVAELDHCFRHFDEITTRFGLEKIKTIGDAHMSASGVTGTSGKPENVIMAGLEIRDFISEYRKEKSERLQEYFQIRIGIHTGPVVAGVVGLKKFSFDIWGDTVNTADRLQTSSLAGKVNVSESTYKQTKEKFVFESRGKIAAKNKGLIPMYFVEAKP